MKEKELEELRTVLKEPLDHEHGSHLASQLAVCESWSGFVATRYREQALKLSEVRGKLFNPSLSSEDKRKIDLEYNTRDQQYNCDIWRDMQDILKRRISLGQTMLRSLMKEQETML